MRRLVAFVLDGVPLCASTERAVAATLADWRHEAGRVPSPGARVIVGLRSVMAVMRAVVGSAVHQLPTEFRSPFLRRVVVATVLTVAFFAWLEPQPRRATIGGLEHAWLSVLVSLNIAMLLVPVVVFAAEATGRQTRSGPSLASGLVMSALLFVTLFVVVPEAYNYLARRTWSDYYWQLAGGRLPPMPSPIRLLVGGPTREISAVYLAFGVLNWLTLSLGAWAFAVLAFRVRQFASPHRVRRIVTVWSAILVVFALVVAVRIVLQFSGLLVTLPYSLVQLVLAAGALTAASWLSRRTADRGLNHRP